MDRLRDLLNQLAERHGNAKVWIGSAPAHTNAVEIAAHVGFAPAIDELCVMSRADAEVWLALFATHSINHGGEREPTTRLLPDIRAALDVLSANAEFYAWGSWRITRRGKLYEPLRADGRWTHRRYHLHFSPAPSAPWEDGSVGAIVGLDEASAFVFAVTEAD